MSEGRAARNRSISALTAAVRLFAQADDASVKGTMVLRHCEVENKGTAGQIALPREVFRALKEVRQKEV